MKRARKLIPIIWEIEIGLLIDLIEVLWLKIVLILEGKYKTEL